jgi:hypothetical protein
MSNGGNLLKKFVPQLLVKDEITKNNQAIAEVDLIGNPGYPVSKRNMSGDSEEEDVE